MCRKLKIDLNKLSPEFDYDFLDDADTNAPYCTQRVLGERERGGSKMTMTTM